MSKNYYSAAVVVGVNYGHIDMIDEWCQDQSRFEAAATATGLEWFAEVVTGGDVNDLYIGVVSRQLPTDALVAAALERVKSMLPILERLLGKPLSPPEALLSTSLD